MDKSKLALGVALVAVIIAIGSFFSLSHSFGAVPTGPVHYQGESFQGGLQVGQRGNLAQNVLFGTCNLSTAVASFGATSTAQFQCSVPGAQAGDLVMADLPVGAGVNGSGAGSNFGGFEVVSAYATTSNVIGVTLVNFSGAATSSYPQATTTVEYRVLR